MPTVVFYIITLAFVWVSIVAAITSFSVGKWVPTAGAFARFLLLGLFILTVIVYAAKHGAHGLGAASYSPTAGGFVLLVGVLLFNFVGFELPNSAGEEMTNPQRDVPFGIARSTVASVILYALPGDRHPDRPAVHRRSPTSAGSSAPSSRSSPCTAATSRPTARPR